MNTCIECGDGDQHLRRHRCKRCYQYYRVHEVKAGRWQSLYVDAQPVKEHVKALREVGLSTRRIAVLAGVNRKVLQWLEDERINSQKIKGTTAKALLGVPIPECPLHRVAANKALVDALGTHRRLKALVAFGYSRSHLGIELGMASPWSNVSHIMRSPRVTAGMACRVEQLFDRLQMTPGPSRYARSEGRRKGWLVPFAWDEDEMDRCLKPCDTVYDRPLTYAQQYDELKYLGFSDVEVFQRLGVKPSVLQHSVRAYHERRAS